jgi:acetyl-CoA carboxylase alpha subunit
MSPLAQVGYFRSTWPRAVDPDAYRLARRILHIGGRITDPDISFTRAMGAVALLRVLTAEESARLSRIAARLVEP